MAKKPRTQVDYNPGQASLQGGVGASAGNYQVSVAPTPKTNAALQFASVINQLPNAAGQLTNYANKVATDRVSQMSDDEILEELSAGDKETFSILKYNKTFNYELVKRKYLMEQQNMANEYDALASDLGNNPDSADIDTAIANMESGLFNKFSGGMTNDLQMQAHKALWNATTAPLKAQAFSKYKALKEEATKMVIESNAMEETFYSGDITNGFRLIKNGLDDLGVPKKEQSQRLMKTTNAYFDRLMFDGRFDEAEAMIGQAEAFEFYSGAKLGGIAEYKSNFLAMRLKARSAKDSLNEEDEVSKTDRRRAHRGKVNSTASALLSNLPVTDLVFAGIKDTFLDLNPGFTEEEVTEIAKEISDAPTKLTKFKDLYQRYGGSLNKNRSDYTKQLFESTREETNKYFLELGKDSPYEYVFTEKQKEELVNKAVTFFEDNPEASVKEFLTAEGKGNLAPGLIPNELYNIKKEATRGFWVKTTPEYTQLSNRVKARFNSIRDELTRARLTLNPELSSRVDTAELDTFALLQGEVLEKAAELVIPDNFIGPPIEDTNKNNLIKEFIEDRLNKAVAIEKALIDSKEAANTFSDLVNLTGVSSEYTEDKDNFLDFGKYEDNTVAKEIQKALDADLNKKDYGHLYYFEQAANDNKIKVKKDGPTFPGLTEGKREMNLAEVKAAFQGESLKKAYTAMVQASDKEALRATHLIYGYPEWNPASAAHLKLSKLSYVDVKLFKNVDELVDVTNRWAEAFNDQDAIFSLSKKAAQQIEKSIKEATSFGLSSPSDVAEFRRTQRSLLF